MTNNNKGLLIIKTNPNYGAITEKQREQMTEAAQKGIEAGVLILDDWVEDYSYLEINQSANVEVEDSLIDVFASKDNANVIDSESYLEAKVRTLGLKPIDDEFRSHLETIGLTVKLYDEFDYYRINTKDVQPLVYSTKYLEEHSYEELLEAYSRMVSYE